MTNTCGGIEVSDTLAEWLHWRFDTSGLEWSRETHDDQLYWEHEADAVRRAVERGGFKKRSKE